VATQTITNLPLFPLGTVLFPQGLLPLRIFEVRYLHMVTACQREGTPFGVVSLLQGSEVDKAGATRSEAFQTIGTLARILDVAAPMPGLLQIRCTGEQRFRVVRHEKLRHGLWVAEVSCLEPDSRVAIPEDLAPVAGRLGQLIRKLQEQGVSAADMPVQQPYELDDCAWVANRWSELLPLSPALKQRLMALESPLLRLELVGDLLDQIKLSF